MKIFFSLAFLLITTALISQNNIRSTNTTAANILKGDFNPSDYEASQIIDDPRLLASGINDNVSPDSLKAFLVKLASFKNRNTGSDTISNATGIGAARRWVFSKFNEFSAQQDSRLIPSYLEFEEPICGMDIHRNIFAVLPGRDTSNHNVIIIEGHMDSRCEDGCDPDCLAEGVEDNASGTALVMELARVMSRFTFNHTLVFLVTVGEEQGLHGARAFALYCRDNDIPIKGVLNNDIVGGIICGETSSSPSCPGLNDIDSTNVRLFSSGSFFSPHKQWARYLKLQYRDELLPIVDVPMTLHIMSSEDRGGRGGDHIPFRQNQFTAMRFTSANEHGDGGPDDDYHDRQHTMRDILGVDTDGDSEIDSFFVNFNYLARNTVINGVGTAMASFGVKMPQIEAIHNADTIHVEIFDPENYLHYLVGVRQISNDFDTLYEVTGTKYLAIPSSTDFYFISAAAVDENGVESCFSLEVRPMTSGIQVIPDVEEKVAELFQNKPNPFDDATYIGYIIRKPVKADSAYIIISDMNGKQIHKIKAPANEGINEVLYRHGYNMQGSFNYSLVINGKVFDTKRMIFAN